MFSDTPIHIACHDVNAGLSAADALMATTALPITLVANGNDDTQLHALEAFCHGHRRLQLIDLPTRRQLPGLVLWTYLLSRWSDRWFAFFAGKTPQAPLVDDRRRWVPPYTRTWTGREWIANADDFGCVTWTHAERFNKWYRSQPERLRIGLQTKFWKK